MDKIQKRGTLIVGTKFDQPLFGLKDATTGKLDGFDVDIAYQMEKAIFGTTDSSHIQFIESVSKNREPFIEQGKVDIVVATYTMNSTREQVVSFAGPYIVAHADILVKASDNAIHSATDLNGKKVCSAQGSTSLKELKAAAPQADTSITFPDYSSCVQALNDGRVSAVVTDNLILAAFAAQSNGQLKVVNAPFSTEPYGIGIQHGDTTFQTFLNSVISKIEADGTWTRLFTQTLATGGIPAPTPPAPDGHVYN